MVARFAVCLELFFCSMPHMMGQKTADYGAERVVHTPVMGWYIHTSKLTKCAEFVVRKSPLGMK